MRLKFNNVSTFIIMMALLLSSVSFTFARRDEGMYTPDQISKLPLKQKGLKIKPSQIYDPNGVAIADAIVRVNIGEAGGFGTGEFVSPNGLILTNHHVGFDALVSASTPEKDYAKNGYKADSTANELPAKDYSLLMTSRVENVTDVITKGTEALTGEARANAIKANIDALQQKEQAKVKDGAMIRIQELNSGLFYYLYETKMIKDVRVVYAPPQSIGFFGGDPDNFEWTRHTGDFTFLRAYVAPDGKSAAYSPNNVPFKPKKFLPISLNGVNEGDFVFVLGYPGGTTRYRESQSVAYSESVNFPFLRDYLAAWSSALVQVGETDEAKRIKLQDQIFSLNNSAKVYEGGTTALKRADELSKKREEERKFAEWIKATPQRQAKYGQLLMNLQANSDEFYKTAHRDRVLRTFPNPGTTPVFKQLYDLVEAVQGGKKLTDEKRAEIQAAYQDREPILERELLRFFLKAAAELPANQKFQTAEILFNRFQGKERRAAEATFAESIAESENFNTPEKIFKLYDLSFNDLKKKYPNIVDFITALSQERNANTARTAKFNAGIDDLRLLYQQGMAEMKKNNPYPDANASLRFTYGTIKGYSPREAVIYKPFTTLKGVIEKDSGVAPFDVPEQLKQLQKSKDFGRFGAGGTVPVNFLADTDIIGGNSGSPIINGFGEQIGIVFDGNYEGLANDIFFNPDYGRTIAVDIRYVLFITEKFGNAGWILNEMNIRGGAAKAARAE